MASMRFEAEPYPLAFESESTALLIIDMQRDFVEPGGFGEMLGNDVSLLRSAVGPCRRVLEAARRAGLTVIHTREGHRPDLADAPPAKLRRGGLKVGIGDVGPMGRVLVRGEYGHDIIPELYPLPGEPVVDKPGKGSFCETDLDLILQNRGVRTLIVCGVTTEVCVHTTVREANDRGYECVVLSDCVGSYFPEFQRVALEMIKAQGGIFGWVSDSREAVRVLDQIRPRVEAADAERSPALGARPMRLQAISAGSRAAPERRFAGVVHSVFRRACNIRADDDGRLLTLLPAQAGNVPHGVRLDVPPGFAFIDHLAVGQPAACRAGVLRFAGAGLAIDLGGARPWRIDVSAPPADLGRPEVAAAWTTAWRGLPRGAERRADDAGLLAHAAARYGLELTVATRRLCLVEAEATVARLVGCGPGLTPAGDDLLVGCMAGLWSTASADPGRRGFLRGLAAAAVGAAPATGDISRNYLEAAAEGEFAETIAVLARRIADGAAAGEIGRAAADALRVGHTSGADGVRGLLLGLAAWSPAPSPFAALRGLQRALDLMPFTPEGFGRGQEAPTLPLTRVPPSPGFRRGRGGVGALYRVARGWGGSGITASGRNERHG